MRSRHRPVSDRDVRDLLDLLYDAALSVDGWRTFLGGLVRVTGSEAAGLMVYDARDKTGDILSIYGADDLVPDASAAWAERNPLATSVRNGTTVGHSQASRREWFGCEFYTDYLSRHFRGWDNMGLCVHRDGDGFAYVTTMRAPDRPDYSHRDWELLDVLRPHLERALALQRRLGVLEVARTAAQQVLDRLPVAVLFLDASRKVVAHNAEAERLLRVGDVLHLDRDGYLRAGGLDGERLAREVAAVCLARTGRTTGSGATLKLRRPEGTPYGVLVSPLGERRRSWFSTAAPIAVVAVSDPARTVDANAVGTLRAVHDLTDAEARLACALASGQTPKQIASALGISMNTVRWTLKQVFAKTGTSRQAELVRLVLNGLSTLRGWVGATAADAVTLGIPAAGWSLLA